MHVRRRLFASSLLKPLGGLTGALFSWAAAPAALAQVTAAGGAADTGTVVGGGPGYTISGGTQTGGNLFHSFDEFNLATGESAFFTDAVPATPIANIISRIVGGNVSTLNGVISVDNAAYPGANFFFINPAGVIMQEGFSFNGTGGDLHISTARELAFADGIRWSTDASGVNTLTAAAPTAFGFLAGAPSGDIDFVSTNAGQSIGVMVPLGSASDVTLTANNISATGSAHDIGIVGPSDRFDIYGDSFTVAALGTGTNEFNLATAAPIAAANGSTTITDAEMYFGIGSTISADMSVYTGPLTLRMSPGRQTTAFRQVIFGNNTGGDLTIVATDVLMDNATSIFASGAGTTGDAGDLTLIADNVTFQSDPGEQGGSISLSGFAGAGTLTINILGDLLGQSGAFSSTANTGAGDLFLTVGGDATLTDNFQISSRPFSIGSGGDITIDVAGDLSMDQSSIRSGGDAGLGNIDVDVGGTISITNFSQIVSDISTAGTDGGFALGNISVTSTGDIFIDNAIIASNNLNSVDGTSIIPGSIELISTAGNISVQNGAGISRIRTETRGSQGAGSILLQALAGSVNVSANIDATTSGSGDAGGIALVADTLNVLVGGQISSSTFGAGNGGFIDIDIGNAAVFDGGGISGFTAGSGSVADLTIDAGSFLADNGATFNFLTSGAGAGANNGANDVTFNIGGAFVMQNGAVMFSNNQVDAIGDAANFTVNADSVLLNNASINAAGNSAIAGDGGTITLNAATDITIEALSSLTADGNGAGSAGSFVLNAPGQINIIDSFIQASAVTSGDAGDLLVNAGEFNLLDIDGVAQIASLTTAGSGTGGVVIINANDVTIDGEQLAVSTFGSGAAGSITVNADTLSIINGGDLSAVALNPAASGDAGLIDVNLTGVLAMNAGTLNVSSLSGASGNAGTIEVDSASINTQGFSFIGANSDAGGTGNGGAIRLTTLGDILIDANVTTNVTNGASGSAGSITVDAGGDVTVAAGGFDASSNAGNGGTVNVTAGGDINNLQAFSFSLLGDGGQIDVTAIGGIDIARLSSTGFGTGLDGAVALNGGGDIAIGDLVTVDTGDLTIDTPGQLFLGDNSIGVTSFTADVGSLLAQTAAISTFGDGGAEDTGDIIFNIANDAQIDFSTFRTEAVGAGNAGDVILNAGGELTTIDLEFFTMAENGNAGAIGINVGGGAQLQNVVLDASIENAGTGNGGAIAIDAGGDVDWSGGSLDTQSINNNGGAIAVIAGGDIITGDAFSWGGGATSASGDMLFDAGGNILVDGSFISALSFFGNGPAGSINVSAGGNLSMINGAFFDTRTATGGDGGAIIVDIDGDVLLDSGGLNSAAFGGATGNAGNISLSARDLTVTNVGGINARTADVTTTGNAGNIAIDLAGDLNFVGDGRITSDSDSLGLAGDISVNANTIIGDGTAATGNGYIWTRSTNTDAGDLSINLLDSFAASNLTLDATSTGGDGGDIEILTNGDIATDQINIDVSTTGPGDAGSIALAALGDIQFCATLGTCLLSANATGSGNGGLISLTGDDVLIGFGNFINANSDQGTGDAGGIIVIGNRIATTDAILSANSGNAAAVRGTELVAPGTIALLAGDILIENATFINADNLAGGDAGHILVRGGRVIIGNQMPDAGGINNMLSAQALVGSGNGGLIEIAGNDVTFLEDVLLDIRSAGGTPGSIIFDADNIDPASPETILGSAIVSGFETDPSLVLTFNGRIEEPNTTVIIQDICIILEDCTPADAQTFIDIVNTLAPFAQSANATVDTTGHVPGGPIINQIVPENEAITEEDETATPNYSEPQDDPTTLPSGCSALTASGNRLTNEKQIMRARPSDARPARYADPEALAEAGSDEERLATNDDCAGELG